MTLWFGTPGTWGIFWDSPPKGGIESRWAQLPCRSVDCHGVFPCPLLQLWAPFCKCLSAGLPLSMAERLMGSPEARVSQSVLIHCCVQKCQRRKLLSGAAYSKVQLCMIPWWTGLNSRCAEASLTLEFVLSVKHSEKSVSKTVPGIYEWLQLNTVLHLFLAKHFLKDFFAAVSLSDHSFSCTTLKLQSL